MTNENNIPAYEGGSTIEHDATESPAPRKGWPLSAKIGIALAAVVGIGAVAAQSAGGFGPGGHGFGPGGFGMRGFGEHRLGGMLEQIEATKDQETKIWAIIDETRSDLRPIGADMRDARGQLVQLLTAPTIDTAAVEKLRAERIAAIDEASKKAVASIVEAAQVLTVEQRAKLATELQQRGGPRP